MTDEERTSSMNEMFGDISAYHQMVPDPDHQDCVRLHPPNDGKFSEHEWMVFLHYLDSAGCKIKASFQSGQILIEDCNPSATQQAGLEHIITRLGNFNDAAAPFAEPVLTMSGGRHCAVGTDQVQPDASWIPAHGVSPSLYFEIGNTQTLNNLLTKVNMVLRYSSNVRYVILIKVWRDPLPDQVAMVAAVWLKTGPVAEGNEWQAISFTSFGNRAPTVAELALFPLVPGDRPWVPVLQGVTESAEALPCDIPNNMQPIFNLTFLPVHFFTVANQVTPPHLLAAPTPGVLVISLLVLKNAIVSGMIADIRASEWSLTNDQLGMIVHSAFVQMTYPRLQQFAVANFQPALP